MILKATSRIVRWDRLLFLVQIGCSRSRLPDRNKLFSLLFATGFFFIFPLNDANAIQLGSDSELSTAGYFQLDWSGPDKVFQLQESTTADFQSFQVVYEGKDLARVMSGKSDGEYFYRVVSGEDNSQVSDVVKVTVAHHPLINAILFFIAGAVVFISTLVLIYKGNRQVSG